jgi:protoporphyrinogen oxidase
VDVHAPELRAGRITNFDNWVPAMRHGEAETVLALEYWCDGEDDFWRWDDERHVALARRELVRTGLVRAEEILDGEVVRMPKSSPVYRRGFRRHLAVLAEHLRGIEGLEVIGRYGAMHYQNQDHSILMGLLAAENILDDAGHDLWSPPGRDARLPPCHITATGLVSQPATRPSLRRR